MEGSFFDRWKVLLWLDEILFKKKNSILKNYLWEGNLTRSTFDVLFDWNGMSEDWYNSIGGFNLFVS